MTEEWVKADRYEFVSAKRFWDLMCNPAFIRDGRLAGRLGHMIYITFEAPEDIPGFLDARLAEIKRVLH